MSTGEKILPHPDVLNEVEYGRFVLANLAAKRAKQIKDGAPPLVRIDSAHPVSIALAEIAAGKIKPILATEAAETPDAAEHLASLESLEIGDMGLLLPAMEEDLDLAVIGLEEEDHSEAEEEPTELSLDGVLEVEDDEAEPAVTDETEISLDDLAEQEEGEDKEALDA